MESIVFFKAFIVTVSLLVISTTSWAHTPLCACFDNGDGTITCEGGFSDGSSAAGVYMRLESPEEKILFEGVMDEDSEFTFTKPGQDYVVIFDSGEAHIVRVAGKDILE